MKIFTAREIEEARKLPHRCPGGDKCTCCGENCDCGCRDDCVVFLRHGVQIIRKAERETVTIETADGSTRKVYRGDFVRASLRGLRETYPSVTAEEVNDELDRLLRGEKWSNVIGAIISRDLVVESQPSNT